MSINFFIPEKCLLYAGIVLYIVITVLVTRWTRKNVAKYYKEEPIFCSAIFGAVWPLMLLGLILKGIFTCLAWLSILGIDAGNKPKL